VWDLVYFVQLNTVVLQSAQHSMDDDSVNSWRQLADYAGGQSWLPGRLLQAGMARLSGPGLLV